MIKNWNKIEGSKYAFSIDGKEIGTVEMVLNSMDTKAIAKIGRNEITIRRTGFWKNTIELTDQNNMLIA